ncbi:MAG: peptidase M1 [Deltaproteobacteria bacterium]|nr:peptidase M1 [Deltaproteobacteria bacterium]
MRVSALVFVIAACGGKSQTPDAPDAALTPTPNLTREIVDTSLAFDVTALTATATITFGPSADPGATLEVGDLEIQSVKVDATEVTFAVAAGKADLGLPASDQPLPVTFTYAYKVHTGFSGAVPAFTFLWPYYCGNLFPCHSDPSDGTTFTLALSGVPDGKTAVFADAIAMEAPSYQVAWAIGDYVETSFGTTAAGTEIALWHPPAEANNAALGGANLKAVFEWLETTIGPYRFGTKVGGVSIAWPAGAFGGMEHHPRWHVAKGSFQSEETQAHEAAHGWYGDGIRIACWEDFVLSEGTVTYLAGRALEVVAPTVGAQVWQGYTNELANLSGSAKVWPEGCNAIDILKDDLYQNAPYIRGAFFYRAVADKVGADKVDQALAAFYAAHGGKAARMTDMLATIQSVTGYDATACANSWLRSTTKPAPGPCP